MSSAKKPIDDEIFRLRKSGLTYQQIADKMDVPKWVIGASLSRSGATSKYIAFSTRVLFKKNKLVERTCPTCARKHMSDPVIWTCSECRNEQNRIDESVWD